MYQQGDLVVYGSHGVCRVTGVEARKVDHKNVEYLVLAAYDQSGSNFLVPLHNANAMGKVHAVVTREELEEMLSSPKVRENIWIADESKRKLCYRELIVSGDRMALMQMVHTLREQRRQQLAAGRKFHQCDENFLRDAQKLLSSEYSVALGISPAEVEAYICNRLEV